DGEQMEHGIGRATRGGDSGNRILECGASENVARQNALPQHVHDDLTAAEGDFIFARVHGGNAIEAHGRQANQLHDRGHGVGGVLAAAGAGAGAGNVLQLEQFRVGHLSRRVGAHRLEYVLNGDVFAFVNSGGDGAAVEYEAGKVHARQCHGGGGNGFVAADHADDRVEHLPATDQLDGVSDDLAADERGAHAFGAHGFAVGDGDGVELHGSAAGGADA